MGVEMNIYALAGYKVIVTENTVNNGYEFESNKVKELLDINKEYTVKTTYVDNWSTTVILQEFPNERFNSVSFEEVNPQSKELDEQHKDYYRYH